ncbi:hypothetical protein, partial [Pseudomonas aeruginosa]|uniref:hypothetical protein n=1 Tax=Pseudomonas aeruginosa TaxID=287 RepID=UPI0021C668E4
AEALGTTDLNGGALFNAEFGIRHRGSTVPERSGVALSFCRRPCINDDAAKMDELIAGRKYDEISAFIELLVCRMYDNSELRAYNHYIVGNGYAVLADRLNSPWDEKTGGGCRS